MQKKLLFIHLLAFLCLGTTLLADDFKISGKVSIVQESVPLPFYDVQIADATDR